MKLTDEKVAKALGWECWEDEALYICYRPPQSRPLLDGKAFVRTLPAFTTSLDAIVAEIEARGLEWCVTPRTLGGQKRPSAGISLDWDSSEVELYEGEGDTAPLALCAALLTYLKATR